MNLELAHRAVACKHWRWMPGMLVIAKGYSSLRLVPFVWRGWPIQEADPIVLQSDCLPDLDDPATLGCLLALVREAWGDQRVNTLPTTDGGWAVADGDDDWICTGTTEAAALVAALEAAP